MIVAYAMLMLTKALCGRTLAFASHATKPQGPLPLHRERSGSPNLGLNADDTALGLGLRSEQALVVDPLGIVVKASPTPFIIPFIIPFMWDYTCGKAPSGLWKA